MTTSILIAETTQVFRKLLTFILLTQLFVGYGIAFSQTQTQSETVPIEETQQLAHDLFEQGKAAHDGINRPQDFEKARALYLKAADLGSTPALLNLGYLYFTGQGVDPDFVRAREFYEDAAQRGSEDAKENIKMMDVRGLGISPVNKVAITDSRQQLPETDILSEAHPPVQQDIITSETTAPFITPDLDTQTSETESKSGYSIDRSGKLTVILISLAVLTFLGLFIVAIKRFRERRIKNRFVQYFYDAKRSQLRKTYLHRHKNGLVEASFYREWHATLTALMARYARDFDEPDEELQAFCEALNNKLSLELRPTQHLASEYSDKLMQAAFSDIKAVDAFYAENVSKKADTSSSTKQLSQVTPAFHDNVVKIFQRKLHNAK